MCLFLLFPSVWYVAATRDCVSGISRNGSSLSLVGVVSISVLCRSASWAAMRDGVRFPCLGLSYMFEGPLYMTPFPLLDVVCAGGFCATIFAYVLLGLGGT